MRFIVRAPGRLPALVAALAIALLAGCSYSPNPANFPAHLKTIAVPVLQNRTPQPGLESEVTEAVVNRFVRDNNLRVVGEGEADLLISGAVTNYTNAVFGFNAREQAQEYQVAVTVSVTVKDRVKNREMWRDDNLIRTANYFVVADPGQEVQDEASGRRNAIEKIADAVLNRTVEGW